MYELVQHTLIPPQGPTWIFFKIADILIWLRS